MATEGATKEKDNDFVITTVVITILIIGLWIGNLLYFKDVDNQVRGTFGDMFGAINALFSGLSLAGIVLAILLQRKELKLQREELSDTRKEFETQNSTLKIQRFENTFFNLLNLHHQIVSEIDFTYYKIPKKDDRFRIKVTPLSGSLNPENLEVVTINSRDVFRFRYNKMLKDLNKDSNNYEVIYKKHFNKAQTDFGHYFRNLYRMFKLIDETDFFYDIQKVSQQDIFDIKYRYTSIVRSQISSYELAWLFYNSLSEYGIEKFKPLIENYALFKNFPKSLIPYEGHLNLYNESAYGLKRNKLKID